MLSNKDFKVEVGKCSVELFNIVFLFFSLTKRKNNFEKLVFFFFSFLSIGRMSAQSAKRRSRRQNEKETKSVLFSFFFYSSLKVTRFDYFPVFSLVEIEDEREGEKSYNLNC